MYISPMISNQYQLAKVTKTQSMPIAINNFDVIPKESYQVPITTDSTTQNSEETNQKKSSSHSPGQDEFLNRVQGWSDADADSYLKYETTQPAVVFFDISEALKGGKIKLSSTGQSFDSYADLQAYQAEFEKVAKKVMEEKRELYETEKAKGTDPKKIISMFVDFDNSQSTLYRAGTGAGFGQNGDHRDYVLNPVLKESSGDSLTALNSGEKLIKLLQKTNSYNQNRLMELSNKNK